MLNFDFSNPTRIVFGEGVIAKLGKLLPEAAQVLIVVGGSSAEKNGTLAEVRAALGTRRHATFSGIEPNPTLETAMRAVAQFQDGGFDFLLAVGGGSVIDAVKFIAAAVRLPGADPAAAWELVRKGGRGVAQAAPLGVVLTLPATGSEMNNGGVLTHAAEGAKLPFSSRLLFPQFALLDPTKTYTLPARQLANGVVDAFVHTMEQYLTYPVDARVQDRFAEGLLQTLIEIGPRVVASDTPDYADRANLVWSATLALNGLIGAGVPQDWSTHMIGHELTALYGIDHARTLAVVLPAMMDARREQKHAKLLQYAERVWGITEGSEEGRINAAITQTRNFFEGLGVPTRLSAYDLGADAADAVVTQLQKHGMVALSEHRDIDAAKAREILGLAI
ncbi:iron-containing alcohol dehydrogenase [Comamonas antarctica]|uniref:Iron-containing alcohol dehydrogenase n=1 Tax=Comamonas antarctica TaxID=2743470 RepID=A0A6N1WXA3_9BURK|nr:iron-containing alcohol dehydrogenase [Comamonas antarctica]QKV51671.1 iron-containing alcohol dehydrogenase [Comamonas antarctica]